MITRRLSQNYTLTSNVTPQYDYVSVAAKVADKQLLSPVAQEILREFRPPARAMNSPEVTALRLLDYVTSKKGYIRRKGPSPRTVAFYRRHLAAMVQPIQNDRPVTFSTLCLCPTLGNQKYAGESPYPHIAAYMGFENLQRIAAGARAIYPPGLTFVLGYEGTVFGRLYFHSDAVIRNSLTIFQEFNDLVYQNMVRPPAENPIKIVDMTWMIEQSFGSLEDFWTAVGQAQVKAPEPELVQWKEWYDKTISPQFFPTKRERTRYINERARWRWAVCKLKYQDGIRGRGFMGFDDEVITFTAAGRHPQLLALQLVPGSDYLPHQRVVVHDPASARWKMAAYEELSADSTVYRPCYAQPYLYPLYYERQPA